MRAEQQAPDQIAELLRYPAVGTWAGYTLRRLRRAESAGPPLWVDLGYLHTLAAAAAIRARLEFRIQVPVRDGFVTLPTLGAAELPARSRWQPAEVIGAGAAAVVATDGASVQLSVAAGWHRLPVV